MTKKDGNPIFCVYYRRINAVMKRDPWPMPRVHEIFDEISASKVFTTMDLFQGYWHIKMDEACTEKSNTAVRSYESSGSFQRKVNNLLANLITGSVTLTRCVPTQRRKRSTWYL